MRCDFEKWMMHITIDVYAVACQTSTVHDGAGKKIPGMFIFRDFCDQRIYPKRSIFSFRNTCILFVVSLCSLML